MAFCRRGGGGGGGVGSWELGGEGVWSGMGLEGEMGKGS